MKTIGRPNEAKKLFEFVDKGIREVPDEVEK
jgi:hypothetical protein